MTSYCRDHDPILAAGFIACQTCGRRAYPLDAAWLGALVLATYPPPLGCPHVRGGTWLVDPSRLTPDTRWCGEITASTGEPCRQRRQPDGSPCRFHTRREVR